MDKIYTSFSKADFLEDAFFRAWVKAPAPDTAAFWEAWEAATPANLAAMQAARQELRAIYSLQRIPAPAGEKEALWAAIKNELSQPPAGKQVALRKKVWIAAAVLLPLMGIALWLLQPRPQKVQVPYAQTRRMLLPDSSVVLLNANSTLRYHRWKAGERREVWLSGEALFMVRHLNRDTTRILPADRFIVHSGQVTVEVLGTVFNIKNRRNEVEVFLQSGKVKVSAGHQPPVILLPSQSVRYSITHPVLEKNNADNAEVTAWTTQHLQLNNTKVKDILQSLQDIYGYHIILKDSSIASRTIDGTLPVKNIDNVLFELSAILQVKIIKSDSTLVFYNKNQP